MKTIRTGLRIVKRAEVEKEEYYNKLKIIEDERLKKLALKKRAKQKRQNYKKWEEFQRNDKFDENCHICKKSHHLCRC